MMLVLLLALAACNKTEEANPADSGTKKRGKTKEETPRKRKSDDGLYSIDDFSNIKTNEGNAIEGGSFTYGLVSDTAFEGTLNFNFYSGDPDAEVLEWFDEGIVNMGFKIMCIQMMVLQRMKHLKMEKHSHSRFVTM